MAQIDAHDFYPQPPAAVFLALQAGIATCDGKIDRIQELTKSIRFTTPRGFSRGGRYIAQVIPRPGGAIARIEGASWSSSVRARNAEEHTVARILAATEDQLHLRL